MITALISRIVILLFGTLYPAYASYKAVRTKNVKEYVKWMMYWIVFAFFTCIETFADIFLSWFPFYYEIKVVLVIWMLSPATRGSSVLYRHLVHPTLSQREQEIDEYINKAKDQGYSTMLNLGSKGVNYATNVIMQTAIKGGGGLVNQLRRSYSLSDLTEDLKADLNCNSKMQTDTVDMVGDMKDIRGRPPLKDLQSQVHLYFPEVDVDMQPYHAHDSSTNFSHIRSNEDISSECSDPLHGDLSTLQENQLMRTTSVRVPRRWGTVTRSRGRGTHSQQSAKVTSAEEIPPSYATLPKTYRRTPRKKTQ